MLKRYGELNGVVYRNYGYCPYNMCIKYKLSYEGEVYYIYVDNFKQLKKEVNNLLSEHDNGNYR